MGDSGLERQWSVENYARFRPSYPQRILPLLEQSCNLTARSTVADIGSGTGLLSELFLGHGCEVWGVEPNAQMRTAGERRLSGYEGFHSVEGCAEETTLDAESVDFAAAGQAFHWFEPARTRREFRRILKSGGWVVLVWNERLTNTPFLAAYEALLHRHAPEYSQVDHRRVTGDVLDAFFDHHDWTTARFANEQSFDLEGVIGRLHSASYAPQPGTAAHDLMIQDLQRIFETGEENGTVAFNYETRVHFGRLL